MATAGTSPDNPPQRVTQKDIALRANVSRSTVTYALKDDPKIALQTRQHIQQIAQQMGYQPDPFLASLANYRNSRRPSAYHGTLVWLIYANYNFKHSPHYIGYFEGASARAPFHGYKLEQFNINPQDKSGVKRTFSILRSRGIAGILLCPLPQPDMAIDLPLEHFSVITFGYTLKAPALHSVASAIYHNTQKTIQHLRAKGYKRIGVITDPVIDLRCKQTVSSAFLGEQLYQMESAAVIPPYLEPWSMRSDPVAGVRAIEDYVKRYELDALVTDDYKILNRLKNSRLKIPEQIGLAGISLLSQQTQLSGMWENSCAIGSLAVDMLTSMIQRGERGIPQSPLHSYVQGNWHPGKTLRDLNRQAKTGG